MFMCFADVLTPEELKNIAATLSNADFVDGKLTAGWQAKQVKYNTQLSKNCDQFEKVEAIIHGALDRNPLLQMIALPKVIHTLLISCYSEGMFYGTHVDNAIMGKNDPIRSDLSLTLFLNSPESYEGGELVIETHQGEEAFKLDAGSMILYPSLYLHRVEPVTKGVRLVAVTWIQSLVRNPLDREILFDLDTIRRSLFEKYGKIPELDLLAKTRSNLLRKWAEF